MVEISTFGLLSNFKINIEKSVLMQSHVPSGMASALQQSFPFVWRFDFIPYLGIYIALDAKRLYDLNYGPLVVNKGFAEMEKPYPDMVWQSKCP